MDVDASAMYRPRVVDAELRARLASAGTVVIGGPKACGKTATASQLAASSVYLDTDASARAAAEIDPSLVLDGLAPRLIDEWQLAPVVWNHLRRAVDERRSPGQFILTGSSVPADDPARHTGAGRFSILRMRPMTLFESGHSTGDASLASIMRGEASRASEPELTIRSLADRITVGGWPAQQHGRVGDAARAARDYLQQIRDVDVNRVDNTSREGTRRDASKVGALMTSLARNTATEADVTVLSADAGGGDGPLDRQTTNTYLNIFNRLMITEDQPAWAPHLRSKAQMRRSPKRHFVDPSLAVAALTAGPERLLSDLNLFGLLFESLVIRDLRVFAQPLDGRVLHYRDNYGQEVDAVVELADGRWAAFEVKLGPAAIDAAAASLLRFRNSIDTAKCGPPAALAVICATGYGYVRDDGVAVIPIGALGP